MKIMIALPCGDSIDTNCVDSLTKLLLYPRQGIDLELRLASGSLVYDARNGLARQAVDGGFDYMLWVDSDMTFPPDVIEKLLANGKDFCCGMFYSRRSYRPCVYSKCGVNSEDGAIKIDFELYKPIPEEPFEVAASGFGLVLMKTELVKEIFAKGGLPFSPMLGLGEDLSACVRFRELGHKLYCDPRVIIGHTAHIVIGGDDYRLAWNNSQ